MLLFSLLLGIQISHIVENGNQKIIYNQDIPSNAQNVSTFEVCDLWSRKVNGECVLCDTTNNQKPCRNLEERPLCVTCTEVGCVDGYTGTNCRSCSKNSYQNYNGCSTCPFLKIGPLYTYVFYAFVLLLSYGCSAFASHYSLLTYSIKSVQVIVALSSLSQVDIPWIVGLQTFVLDPLAVQWECFGIPFGYAPLMGLVMIAGFWVINILLWGIIYVYIQLLKKYFSDTIIPNMHRVIDSTIGAWSFYIEWQSPILVYRFVQGLQFEWIPNLIGLLTLIIIAILSFVFANRVKTVIFPGTKPFVKFGPLFYKYKPDYFYFYLLSIMWWGLLATNSYLPHPNLQRIVVIIVLLLRSTLHYLDIYKRPITWCGELALITFGMTWCFGVDKSYSWVIFIVSCLVNLALLALEISWCYQKTWIKNQKPEVV